MHLFPLLFVTSTKVIISEFIKINTYVYTHKVKGNWNEGISRCERSVSGRQRGRTVAPDSAEWRKANRSARRKRRELL